MSNMPSPPSEFEQFDRPDTFKKFVASAGLSAEELTDEIQLVAEWEWEMYLQAMVKARRLYQLYSVDRTQTWWEVTALNPPHMRGEIGVTYCIFPQSLCRSHPHDNV